MQDLCVGDLHFKAVDFGDAIRLTEATRICTRNEDPFEKKQCALIHLVAGAIWHRDGGHLGIPYARRVLGEAEEWGVEEFREANNAMESVKLDPSQFADEIRSLAHDAVTPGHDRDYRILVVFFADLMLKRRISIRVFDLRHREEGGVYAHGELVYPPTGAGSIVSHH